MNKVLYSIPEVVEVTGLGRSTVYLYIATGAIASVKVGSRRLVPAAAIDTFVAKLVDSQPQTA
jgi:excisionase family DNA binding protein